MKKFLLTALILFSTVFTAFASNIPFVELSVGLSSGHIFYGEENIKLNKEIYPLAFEDGKQILAGVNGCFTLNFTNRFGVFADAEIIGDFNWQEKNYSHHFDYSISSGIKFSLFSAIPGLTATVGYLLGSRTDLIFVDVKDEITKVNCPWGNGYKFGLEFNFTRMIDSRFLPTIGCYWRHIPRGNFLSDNSLCAYAQINLY